ncbi:hypothetical protein ADUPG1_003734, partial [Aduncisulcus paluster]
DEEEVSVVADSERKPGEKRRTGSPESRNKFLDEHNLLHQPGEDLDEDTEFESCMESGVVDIIHEEIEEFSQVEFLPIPMDGEPNHSTQGEEEQQPQPEPDPQNLWSQRFPKKATVDLTSTVQYSIASPANSRIDPVTTSETNASVPPLGAATERPQPTIATAMLWHNGLWWWRRQGRGGKRGKDVFELNVC